MANDRYYPSLADLLSTDALPSELGFIKTGITDFFGKLYFKDFQFSKSESDDRAFYSPQPPAEINAIYQDSFGIERNGNISGQEPVKGMQMLRGPGGSYLSNEIFYRVARLREKHNEVLPTGHYHISKEQGFIEGEMVYDFPRTEINTLIDIVKSAINKGVSNLN